MNIDNLNITEIIIKTLNDIFSQTFSSIDNNVYSVLDEIIFINPKIVSNTNFQKIFGTSSYDGILLICNSLILGFIIYYAITYLLSHLTYSKIDTPKQFIFKCIIFIAIMNSSLWICEEIINLVFLINNSLSDICNNLFGFNISFSTFIDNINKNIYLNNSEFSILSFDGIIKSFTSFGLISTSSEWFFKIWLKSFMSLLFVQLLISIILLFSYSINFTQNNILSKILYIGILYALTRANLYIKELFGGISTNVSSSFLNFSRKFN